MPNFPWPHGTRQSVTTRLRNDRFDLRGLPVGRYRVGDVPVVQLGVCAPHLANAVRKTGAGHSSLSERGNGSEMRAWTRDDSA